MKRKMPVEVYSRVVGYFRPASQWNKGKQEELKDRHQHKPSDVINQLQYRGGGDDKELNAKKFPKP